MSSSKNQKKWKDQVTEDFLKRSKITEGSICKFQDQITFASNPNDVPLRRERKFEKTVYKISKIDKKNGEHSPKKEIKSENLDIGPDQFELLAEIDKHIKRLEGQKKFLQMAKESQQNKTWSEHLLTNHFLKQKKDSIQNMRTEENVRGCDRKTENACDLVLKLLQNNCIKVTDSCTQMKSPVNNRKSCSSPQQNKTKNFAQNAHLTSDCSSVNVEERSHRCSCPCRTCPIKMVDSGTQIGTSVRCSKHQSERNKKDECCSPINFEYYMSPGSCRMRACDDLDFLTRCRPVCRSKAPDEITDYCCDDSQERFQTTYSRSYKPPKDKICLNRNQRESRLEKDKKTKVIYSKSPNEVPAFLLDEDSNKKTNMKIKKRSSASKPKSPKMTGISYARQPRSHSIEKDLNRMPYTPVKLSEEIRHYERRTFQKSPRSRVSNQQSAYSSPEQTQKSSQATDSTRSRPSPHHKYKNSDPRYLQSDSQTSLRVYKNRKGVRPHNVKPSIDGDLSKTKQSFRQTYNISEKKIKVKESRPVTHEAYMDQEPIYWKSDTEIMSSTKDYYKTPKDLNHDDKKQYSPLESQKTHSRSPTNDLSVAAGSTHQRSLGPSSFESEKIRSRSPTNNLSAASGSVPQRSFNVIRPNVVDDTTYTQPNNTESKDYVILPYVHKANTDEFGKVPSIKLETTENYSENHLRPSKNIVDKSAVILEDLSSHESQLITSMPARSHKNEMYQAFDLEPKESFEISISIAPRSPRTEMKHRSYKLESSRQPQMNTASSNRSHQHEIKSELRGDLKISEPDLSQNLYVKNEENLLKIEPNDFDGQIETGDVSYQMAPTALSSETNICTSNVKKEQPLKSDLGLKTYADMTEEKHAHMSNAFKSSSNEFLNESSVRSCKQTVEDLNFIKSEIDRSMSKISPENIRLSEVPNQNVPIPGIDSELQNYIQYLQNRLKDCDEMVRRQTMMYDKDQRETEQKFETCRIEPQLSCEVGKPEDIATDQCQLVEKEIGAGGECSFDSEDVEVEEFQLSLDCDQIRESELELEKNCTCCDCEEEHFISTRTEIAPYSGCDCMKEGYYKIMQLVYNN